MDKPLCSSWFPQNRFRQNLGQPLSIRCLKYQQRRPNDVKLTHPCLQRNLLRPVERLDLEGPKTPEGAPQRDLFDFDGCA